MTSSETTPQRSSQRSSGALKSIWKCIRHGEATREEQKAILCLHVLCFLLLYLLVLLLPITPEMMLPSWARFT